VLTLTLHVKPLSINDATQGRHRPTTEKVEYETRLHYSLPKISVVGNPYYRVWYDFHLVRFSTTDWDNLPKVTQDCLVKKGIISDDRFIIQGIVSKFPAKKDRIVIRIEPTDLPEEYRPKPKGAK
jgi:Holliday junction resolvase RusA-like endonuclease